MMSSLHAHLHPRDDTPVLSVKVPAAKPTGHRDRGDVMANAIPHDAHRADADTETKSSEGCC